MKNLIILILKDRKKDIRVRIIVQKKSKSKLRKTNY